MNRRTAVCSAGLMVLVVGCGKGSGPQPVMKPKTQPAVVEKTTSEPMAASPEVKPLQAPVVEKDSGSAAIATTFDAIAADTAKFDRKRVEVTAKVARPGHNSFVQGGLAVFLTGDGTMTAILGQSPFVTAVFSADEKDGEKLRTLPPKQEVTVSGELRLASKEVWELHAAKLVKTGEDPTETVTATALTKVFIDDNKAAAKKYGEQPLRVTGKISGKPFEFGMYAAVTIVGAPNADGVMTAVVAQFRPDHFNSPGTPPLNGGQLVTMLPYEDGSEIELFGTLQLTSFGTGKNDEPVLALDAYPVKWPVK